MNNDQNLVFKNNKTKETSPSYPAGSYLYPTSPEDIMLTANDPNNNQYIILQPIFASQPKVWLLIKRDFETPFPGLTDAESKFLPNGNLFLVTSASGDPQTGFKPFDPEVIPIDYSIFEKSVNKPICYSIHEEHKLRPCTTAEAKLRTPSLKVFLGEK